MKLAGVQLLLWAQAGLMAHTPMPTVPEWTISNARLSVRLDPVAAGLVVEDRKSGRTWHPLPPAEMVTLQAAGGTEKEGWFELADTASGLNLRVQIALEGEQPEVIVRITGKGKMKEKVTVPAGFHTREGDLLILPLNQGISYPVTEEAVEPMNFILFGGHGLCMPWYGVTDGESGWMAMVETPDDAAVDMARREGRLTLQPEWWPQKGQFGYERRMRFVFIDQGGYVAMAKRYRQYAKDTGLFKTLAQKRKERPDVDKLVGAASVWLSWQDIESGPEICREMREAGMERILWSTGGPGDVVRTLNDLGALTSCYDIYQDAMNPEHFPRLTSVNPRWTTEAWANDDIILDEQGRHYSSWRVEAKNGDRIACGVLCDRQLIPYALARIPAEQAERPYRARMIDTTTAARWRECYHPEHPMTRTECKRHRMELLRTVSEELGQVLGSEAGHDAAVPYVDYFEGMMSLWPYRVPDSGHKPPKIYDEVPEPVAKFQTGHRYRLPLWELVYHDCVVSHWYWGDFNNKLPALWDRRDLFNVLYGTPPMYRFGRKEWGELKERIVQSYLTTVPVARATGYSEMLSHEWLTDDHAVQRTVFANGVTVTVNFGDRTHRGSDGLLLKPLSFHVDMIAPVPALPATVEPEES